MSKPHGRIRQAGPSLLRNQSGTVVSPVRRRPYLSLIVGLGFCLAVGVAVAFGARGLSISSSRPSHHPVQGEDEQLCERFMRLKNAGDPDAATLIDCTPQVPDRALSEKELEELQTTYFLHDSLRIHSVLRADEQSPDLYAGTRFVLVTEGRVAAPNLPLKTRTGVERTGRTMLNPDLIVEVRQGKIHGCRAELHMGP